MLSSTLASMRDSSSHKDRLADSRNPKQTFVWRMLHLLVLSGVLAVTIYTSAFQMANIETRVTHMLHAVNAGAGDTTATASAKMVFYH